MTIREIFIHADARVVNDFFCSVPIKESRDERILSVCQGLQYFAEHGSETKTVETTDNGKRLSDIQLQIITKHFEALLLMVYEALGINSDDKSAEEKLNAYLNQDVEMKAGKNVNDTAIRLIWEMPGTKDYHYKYIERIRQTTDHSTLRRWLQETEDAIKAIVGENPLHFYMDYPRKSDLEKVHDYLGIRRMLLDRMFTYSDEEVKRFEKVNDLLVDLSKQMYHRTANLYRTILTSRVDKDFDDDYEVEGTLKTGVEYDPEYGAYDTVLHLDNDDYYGSDFPYMLYVLCENDYENHHSISYIENCIISHSEGNTTDFTDEELGCDWTFLNDGESWIEWHRHPKLNHICVCYSLHSMFAHHQYSLADIIRVNNFCVDCKIVCQHITDQERRRFKEIREDE